MPINLFAEPESPTLSTHEGLKMRVRVVNKGVEARELPSLYDTSGALTFALYRPDGTLVRKMSALTGQAMTSTGRLDPRVTTGTLPAGESWERTIDLARFHYTIPPGEYVIEAVLENPATGARHFARPADITVSGEPIRSVTIVRDNPVIHRVAVLLRASGGGVTTSFLRQHGAEHPLAAAYSERLAGAPDLDARGTTESAPFVVASAEFQTASFDPYLETWLVWRRDDGVHAQRYVRGRPTGEPRSAPLPADRALIPAGAHLLSGDLLLFCRTGAGVLECWRWRGTALEKAFEREVPYIDGAPTAIRVDAHSIHVAVARRGIYYERLGHDGEQLEHHRLYWTQWMPILCEIGAVGPGVEVRAAYRDCVHGRTLLLVATRPETGETHVRRIDLTRHRGELAELSFERDARGRFHTLLSTTRRRLYYYADDSGPTLIAEGEERFFPYVRASRRAYLGCFRRDVGYRFLQVRKREFSPRIVEYDTIP